MLQLTFFEEWACSYGGNKGAAAASLHVCTLSLTYLLTRAVCVSHERAQGPKKFEFVLFNDLLIYGSQKLASEK